MASSANKHSDKHEHNYTMSKPSSGTPRAKANIGNGSVKTQKRFADMGITAVWIPPPTKGASASSTGYDIYDTWDLGEFAHPRDVEGDVKPPNRTKYGTREHLEKPCKSFVRMVSPFT